MTGAKAIASVEQHRAQMVRLLRIQTHPLRHELEGLLRRKLEEARDGSVVAPGNWGSRVELFEELLALVEGRA